jgi:hypothetical protein
MELTYLTADLFGVSGPSLVQWLAGMGPFLYTLYTWLLQLNSTDSI